MLEDRALLSTYVVNVLTDTGAGSGQTGDLRYCVTNATSGQDTIDFAPGLSGTIRLQGALPTLNASVTIQGGANALTVQGGAYYYSPYYFGNLFTIGSAANVQISGLTIDDALTAVNNAGSLVLNDCALLNCTDWDGFGYAGYGSALYNTGSATLNNSTVENNYSRGGAVSNAGTLTISNSNVSQNRWGYAIGNGGSAIVSGSTLSGNQNGDIFNFNGASLTVSNSTLSGNKAGADGGGGIFNDGTLAVNNSTLSGNKAAGAAAFTTATSGGGVKSYPGSSGIGGGIFMNSGTLSINSSTLEGNQAIGGSTTGSGGSTGGGFGGGLYIAGGTVSINNSTLADNQAIANGGSLTAPGGGFGGGIYSSIYNSAGASALQMHDTILANNIAGTAPDLDGNVTSLGHNLIGNTSGGGGFAATDLLNVNPQLGSLQNNGGPTQTMALLAGSPAIDAGDNTNAPADDQRGPGFPRIVNGIIDIGAFEVQNSTQPSSLAVAGFPAVTKAGASGTFTVTALNADGTTDTGYTGSISFTSSDAKAALPASYTFTAADAGKHTFSATLFTAGTQSVSATDTTTALTGTDRGITVQPAAASTLLASGFPSPTTAGASHTFVVTAKDAYGNVATGYTGTVHFTSSDARAALPANYTFTAADAGVHTFSAALKTAGTQSITATDTAAAGITGADGGITVQPAAASKFLLSAPSGVTPGVAFRVTLTVEDAYGNVVTGYAGTVHFSSSDGTATLPSNYTFSASDAGVHTFTGLVLHMKGKQKITVTDTQNSSLTATVTEQVA
jgi:hypothetical protein